MTRCRWTPAASARSIAVRKSSRTRPTTASGSASRSGSDRGLARLCASTSHACDLATASATRSSARPETSLAIDAPAWRHASTTAARLESIDIGTLTASRSLRTAVTARRSSCSGATSAWPGRDEAAPTSRMSAPSRSISTPRRTRASTSSPYPSPENESSVALRIPISNVRSRESCSATGTRAVSVCCLSG